MKQQGPATALIGETARGDDGTDEVRGTTSPTVRANPTPTGQPAEPGIVIEDLLVEEISIDGMCGVY